MMKSTGVPRIGCTKEKTETDLTTDLTTDSKKRVSRGSEIGFVRHTCLKKDEDGLVGLT